MTTPFEENDDPDGQGKGAPGPAAEHDDDDHVDPAELGELDEIQLLRKERDELFERLARATADYKNSQRRLQADKEQAVQYANSQLIKTLLPVIDNFERALQVDATKADAASILKGMQIVHDQWINVLRQQNVELINPEPGTPFDPNQHEAVMQQPGEKYDQPTVTQLFARGYALHNRTLRPAQVAVSRQE